MTSHRLRVYVNILYTFGLHYNLNYTRAFLSAFDIELAVPDHVYETQEFI
jgi:hypothetical protein